jgi:hypothetical protein
VRQHHFVLVCRDHNGQNDRHGRLWAARTARARRYRRSCHRAPRRQGVRLSSDRGLAAQHRVLVLQNQEFGILGHLTPGSAPSGSPADGAQAGRWPRGSLRDIPARQTVQARSSNRAPQPAVPRQNATVVRVGWRAIPLRRGSWPSRGRTPRP